jgi:hypothetical protein
MALARSVPRWALAREHIGESLRLYFERDVIASTSSRGRSALPALNFPSLLGEDDYRKEVAKLYATKPKGWLTPVATFWPHYSHAIARWILASHRRRGEGRSLHVVEVRMMHFFFIPLVFVF